MRTLQPAVPPSKHKAGRQKPMGQRAKRRAKRERARRISEYLDSKYFAKAMEAIEGSVDGPGT